MDYKNEAYDKLVDDAKKDDRVGNHDWYVESVTVDTWDDGQPRIKILGKLLTAGSARADLTISPPPPPEEAETWDRAKKRAIGMTVNLLRQFDNLYGVTDVEKIEQGTIFRVKTGKSNGFIRVIALRPKSEISKAGVETAAIPF